MKIRIGIFLRNIKSVFENMWSKRLRKALLILSGALLLAAAVAFFIFYNKGNIATENANKLLSEYEHELNTTSSPKVVETPCVTSSLIEQEASLTPVPTLKNYEGYKVIGKLMIDEIGAELPVISETSTTALEVSCCYYKGAMPGEQGNLVITGHDYASGAIFGRLNEVKPGDTVVLSTPLKDYTYEVYETKIIKPDDFSALAEYQGDIALTLMTCTSHGNRRLLVRCTLTATKIN